MGSTNSAWKMDNMTHRFFILVIFVCTVLGSVEGTSWAGLNTFRNRFKNTMRSRTLDVNMPQTSGENLGMYQRKTQAPNIWLNLHKTLPTTPATSWYANPYEQERNATSNARRQHLRPSVAN